MNKTQLTGLFRTAVHYYRPPSPPPEEWQEDLENCRKLGLDLVQIRVFWCWHERFEGQYDWRDLDAFLDAVREAGCRAVLQICLENAPDYVFKKYDGYRMDLRGNRIWPIANAAFYAGGWIPCFDNPEVMNAGLRFTETLAEHCRDNEVVEFYSAWNEPRCRPMGECTCPASVKSFQEYLRQRFGSIEALNRAFGKCRGDFDQIDAARDTGDFAEMYLWRQWGASRVRDRLEKVVAVLRRVDPERAAISHVGMCSVIQDPLTDISDDLIMDGVADLYGTSFPTRIMPEATAFMLVDWMRYVTQGRFSVYELYPGNGQFFPEVPAGLVEQWIWASVAGGAKLLCFWQYKKERVGLETDDAGLVEMDGTFNDTTRIVEKSLALTRALEKRIPAWTARPAQVAVVYDLKSDLTGRLEVTTPRDGDYSMQYSINTRVPGGYPAKGDMQGIYNLLWRSHFQVDFLSPARWSAADMVNYPVIVIPGWFLVDEERANCLKAYVEQGGNLLVDAGFGRRQINTMLHPVRPGAGLAEFFGFREKRVVRLNGKVRKMDLAGIKELETLYESVEYLPAEGTEVIGRWCDNGAPAAVRRSIGRGSVTAIGALYGLNAATDAESVWNEVFDALGAARCKTDAAAWRRVLRGLLGNAGVEPDGIWNLPGTAERCMLDENGREIHFLFRCFDGSEHISLEQFQALELPDSKLLVDLDNVRVWETSPLGRKGDK